MGWWNGTKLGFKVDPAEEELAQQFLTVLGVNLTDCDMTEEIGELTDLSDYTVDGLVEGNLLGIMPSLDKKFSDYQKKFEYFYDEDEEEEEEEDKSSNKLDDLFQAAKKILTRPCMYLAHEDGNSTSDTYYRCEVIYSSNKKKELNCFYSYGDGVNVDSDNPKEEGTQIIEEKIAAKKPDSKIIKALIKKAKAEGFDELIQKLEGSSDKTDSGNKAKKQAIPKIPGMKIVKGVLVRYSGKSEKNIVIPEGVTEIGDNAFNGNITFQSVVIPEGVKSIGESAFYACYGLKEVSLPQSLESIGDYAFNQCNDIKRIDIPAGVRKIGNSAFGNCSHLTDIVIPENVKAIGSRVFYNCYALEHMILPPRIKEIGNGLFYGCKALKAIDIPRSVKRIGNEAFLGCAELTEIKLPAGLKEIGGMAFERCDKLEKLVIPESVTSIGWRLAEAHTEIHIAGLEFWLQVKMIDNGSALINGSKLYINNEPVENLVIPSTVSRIGDSAFSGCGSIVSVTIPDTVIDIGYGAFVSCRNLQKAVVPKALEGLIEERRVFHNCKQLTDIQYV